MVSGYGLGLGYGLAYPGWRGGYYPYYGYGYPYAAAGYGYGGGYGHGGSNGWWVYRPTYDRYGHYIGRRPVNVC
jgi:hypothetical protein